MKSNLLLIVTATTILLRPALNFAQSGPTAPVLGSAACYALFSADGTVANTGLTYVTGDVGTNVGTTAGFNNLYVTGKIHPVPDASTAQCATDLDTAYYYLNKLPYDVELPAPAQFGHNTILTAKTYLLNAATTFTDTLYLDAQNNSNAVFVIQINGAITTSTYSNVQLMNQAQAKNVYWKIDGAVNIKNNSVFNGTIVSKGAISLDSGVVMNGRALTLSGSLSTYQMTARMPPGCTTTGIYPTEATHNVGSVLIYPNPFNTSITVRIDDVVKDNYLEFEIYNILGAEVMNTTLHGSTTILETGMLPAGVYIYQLIGDDHVLQTGKLVSY